MIIYQSLSDFEEKGQDKTKPKRKIDWGVKRVAKKDISERRRKKTVKI